MALLTAALLAVGLGAAAPASAAFPGVNGKLAFDSARDGNFNIYVMNPDGSSQTRLTTDPASDNNPTASPDGTKIAFRSSRDGNQEIYAMNADGTGQTRLTNNPASDADPSWSPDGAKIVFVSDRDGGAAEIYVMNADGTAPTRLTTNAAGDNQPAWSPDGTKIVFRSDRDGNLEIYVMNADGGGQTNRTTNATEDSAPSWSPDGTKIAFYSKRDDPARELYAMNADGSGVTRLTTAAGQEDSPAWSPDGTKIAYRTNGDGNREIYAMNADGAGQTRLTTTPTADEEVDWAPLRVPPSATTGLASAIKTTSATVSGTVNPNGSATSYHFEYGPTTAYGKSPPSQSAGLGTTAQAASASIAGLAGGHTYHYRLVATNAAGTARGLDRTFTTKESGNPFGLPSTKKCLDRRRFTFKFKPPPAGTHIVDVKLFINGKRKVHLKGKNIRRVIIKKLPKKKFKVRIVQTQDRGDVVTSTRRYHGCKKSKPKTHVHRPH